MCEEVEQPATQVPKAMVMTIVINTLGGLFFLIPLVFVLPNQAELAALLSGQPVPTILKSAVGSAGGAFGLLVPLLVLGICCGTACTTAASRCTWAFARDGAIPGAKWWRTVNEKLDVPLNAMMLSMVVQIVLAVIYFGSAAAFNAFSGVGVICLTLSYACPIAVSLLDGRKRIADGSFNLGPLGLTCNVIALGRFGTFAFEPNIVANKLRSMVRSGNSSLLHAYLSARVSNVDELWVRRLRSLLRHLVSVVLGLGQEELRRAAYA